MLDVKEMQHFRRVESNIRAAIELNQIGTVVGIAPVVLITQEFDSLAPIRC